MVDNCNVRGAAWPCSPHVSGPSRGRRRAAGGTGRIRAGPAIRGARHLLGQHLPVADDAPGAPGVGLDPDVTAASAGLAVAVPGGPVDPRAIAALAMRGYGGIEHRARQFEPAMLARADLVLGLDSGHRAELRRIAARSGAVTPVRLLRSARLDDAGPGSGPDGALDVPDPFAGTIQDYLRTLDLIEAAMPGVIAVVRALRQGRPDSSAERGSE